jgi:putative transferase (TIGR04331 family)
MLRRFLITTALEDTWRDEEPILFLGEWCRLYRKRNHWSALDAEVLPYHWDDRAKLQADYQYLKEFHERLLQDLTAQLNQLHGVDRSLRYWRILIGPWLGYFTQILFDRWTSVQQAAGLYELSATVVLTDQEETRVPSDMTDFIGFFLSDDWNHHVYATVLREHTAVRCIEQAPQREECAPKALPGSSWPRRMKQTAAGLYERIVSAVGGDPDVFLSATYLPLLDEMRLQLRLGQVPQHWRAVRPDRVAVDGARRQWMVMGENRSEFEACARAMIPRQMPTAYLEGYDTLVSQTRTLRWPKSPRLIWTSNSQNSNEIFKAWTADKVEGGARLVIGQHGGHYGIGRWSFSEDHEVSISDYFLSWGWSEPEQRKVKPLGQLTSKRPLGVRHHEQPRALLVTCIVPRQSYLMFSAVVANQWLDYFDDQCAFVANLPAHIRDALTVRLHAHDYGWEQAARWRERFPALRVDDGQSDINVLIRQSRLYISTYNATTYLESFTMNVPTVIYWNPAHWELRESAIPYFDDLKRVGIFHENPESAARHAAAIWDDVEAWWASPDVREVLDRFKERYSHLPDDLLDELERVLRESMVASNSYDVDAPS